MDTDPREHSVMVWGEPHSVTVYRKSETVYEAIGNYMCETISVNDQSEGAAIKRWREAAAGVSPSE
jgi:predicted transcriptional regulator